MGDRTLAKEENKNQEKLNSDLQYKSATQQELNRSCVAGNKIK